MRAPLTAIVVALVIAMAGSSAAEAAFTIGPATVTSTGESGTLTFTVTRSGDLAALLSAATVKVSTADGTAAGGADFTALSQQTVSLGGLGQPTTAQVNVPILTDTLDEADTEDLTVVLSAPTGDALGAPATARGVITDDDAPPSVSLGTPTAVAEGTGTEGPGLVFPVTLSAPSGQPVSVAYATADGTAAAVQDYAATAGTLVIPAGSTGGTVTVPVVPDAVDEADETLGLTLSAPADATLGATPTATGTITDDDTATLSVAGTVVTEGAAGTTSIASAQINLSTSSDHAVSVTYATVDGTAIAPGDYAAAAGQVSIPAGQRFALVPVTVVGDATPEATEVLGVRISDPVGATIASGGDLAPVVLTNDDGALPSPSPASGTGTTPGGATSPGPSTGGGTAAKAVRLGKASFSRATGRLSYTVTCPAGGGACRVGLTVFSVPAPRSKIKALRSEQQLATKTQTVPAGRTATFKLRLPRRARGWLRTAKSIRTNAYAVSKDATGAYSTARVAATLKR